MSNAARCLFAPQRRAASLRRHFVQQVPLPYISVEYSIQASGFFGWWRLVLGNLDAGPRDLHQCRSDESALDLERYRRCP